MPGHPLPDEGKSEGCAPRARGAAATGKNDVLVVLISGGGSALMALPADGISLEAKQQTARTLMAQSADIYELNTVRKHLSGIKGGRLATVARGKVLTLAVSDVVGDDLSVIASGPTVADESIRRCRRRPRAARRCRRVSARGRGASPSRRGGRSPETPKRGDARLAHAAAYVIGPQRGAIEGARRAAEQLGYHVHVVAEPIKVEARLSARAHMSAVSQMSASLSRPLCVISSGETTVTVVGTGREGGTRSLRWQWHRCSRRWERK